MNNAIKTKNIKKAKMSLKEMLKSLNPYLPKPDIRPMKPTEDWQINDPNTVQSKEEENRLIFN